MSYQIQADLPGLLGKLQNQNFPFQTALLELIDNTIDESATVVDVYEKEDGSLVVEDNGRGFRDIAGALIIGKSTKKGVIGRYGVGLKDASVRYSEATTIESRGVRITAPWNDIINEIATGEVDSESIDDDGRTRVILENFREIYRQPIRTDAIRRVYAPLLDLGNLRISVNGKNLAGLERPAFTDEIEESFEWRDKRVHLVGGLFPHNDPMRRMWAGYNPYYQGRLIGEGKITNVGVGDEGCTNFAFILHLQDAAEAWRLATNKDAVESLDELLDHCYDTITRELLIKGATEARDIELKEVEDAVTRELQKKGNQTRRSTRGRKGTVTPTETGKTKRNTNTATTDGEYNNKNIEKGIPRAKFSFRFEYLDGDTWGEVKSVGKRVVITANLDNPFVRTNKTNTSTMIGMAKMAYAIKRKVNKGNTTTPDMLISEILDYAGSEMAWSGELPEAV